MNFKKRFGNFLMIIGFILLVLFVGSDFLEQVNIWYLLFGVLLFAFGFSLARKGRTPPKPSQRFRTVRRLFGDKQESDSGEEIKDELEE